MGLADLEVSLASQGSDGNIYLTPKIQDLNSICSLNKEAFAKIRNNVQISNEHLHHCQRKKM
jgi:hypothetical protein